MATTLTAFERPYSKIDNYLASVVATQRWPWRAVSAAAITLRLFGGVGYYFQQPSPPSRNTVANLGLAALQGHRQETSPLDSIKKLEDLVKRRETQQAQEMLPALLEQARLKNDQLAD
jgi:hypothetical protein